MSLAAFIVTFKASHAAIRAERSLKDACAGLDLIPVPREISSACGFCLMAPIPGSGDSLCDVSHGHEEEAEPIRAEALLAMLDGATCADRESLWAVSEMIVPGKRRKEKYYERVS